MVPHSSSLWTCLRQRLYRSVSICLFQCDLPSRTAMFRIKLRDGGGLGCCGLVDWYSRRLKGVDRQFGGGRWQTQPDRFICVYEKTRPYAASSNVLWRGERRHMHGW